MNTRQLSVLSDAVRSMERNRGEFNLSLAEFQEVVIALPYVIISGGPIEIDADVDDDFDGFETGPDPDDDDDGDGGDDGDDGDSGGGGRDFTNPQTFDTTHH